MDIDKILAQLTLQEKTSLLSGEDFWHTKAVSRLGVPQIMVADGPHGLRKQETGDDAKPFTIQSTCFPSASALGCSWDRALCGEVGAAIGEECQRAEVDVILGPGVNIKRSPLCGRNFEYYSEDPCVAGELSAAWIKGVQSQGVGACVKHFAVNNQEHRRLSVDARVSARALREIYLANFEIAVEKGKPYLVMTSYNRVNGEYACESRFLLTDILRGDWGFDGVVVSDWGATNDRTLCLEAGMELEMPTSGGLGDRKVEQAVRDGLLDEALLDQAVRRLLEMVERCVQGRKQDVSFEPAAHHALARKAAAQSGVLLQNGGALPLQKGERVLVTGGFALSARYQGGGSSHINSFFVDQPLEELKQAHSGAISFAQGYRVGDPDKDDALIEEAVTLADKADKIVVFAGLPDADESEGYDRRHLELPACQNALIEALVQTGKPVSVVLFHGAPVNLPWRGAVDAVLSLYLAGEAVGGAAADLLTGRVNPSGKLTESYPVHLAHNPSFLNFPGEMDRVEYAEDIFVGYRYYEKKQLPTAFPFGYGLSYTRFVYSGLVIERDGNGAEMTVRCTVENTGCCDGAETVQCYVGLADELPGRPVKELRGFEKVFLKKGEKTTVSMTLCARSFAYYSENDGCFLVRPGNYTISVGASSADIRLRELIQVSSQDRPAYRFHRNSTLLDLMNDPCGKEIYEKIQRDMPEAIERIFNGMDDDGSDFRAQMTANTTLRSLVGFSRGLFSEEMLDEILQQLNQPEMHAKQDM